MTKIAKKALLIGINYTKTDNELSGCINDTDNLGKFLISNKYFSQKEMTFMNDFKTGSLYPSKKNILLQFDQLVKFAKTNSKKKVFLFLSYSGHGSYVRDTNGEEADGRDEVLCPIDCEQNGFIIDDVVRSRLVDKLPSNVTLIVLMDACHSGTILDLRYNYNCDIKDTYSIIGKMKDTKCNVVMISGCKDNQTSADAYIADHVNKNKEYQGAMTGAFIANYKNGVSAINLVTSMRLWLSKGHFSQIPQFSSGKKLHTSRPFLLSLFK